MNILLLGPDGQVGWELQRSLAVLGPLQMAGRTTGADFLQPDSLVALLERVAPDVIVNAAAYTAVDRAESEPDAARTVNALTPAVVAAHAARTGALLVHYSTDYVYDGSGDAPRTEDAPTAPLNVYGATKLEGEDAIRASGCAHLILRTSWVYAARGGNFARTMLRLAAERDKLSVIDDQIGAPTGAALLADATAHAVAQLRGRGRGDVDRSRCGTYHLCAAGQTSWHGYATRVIETARARGLPIRVAPDAIGTTTTANYPTPARRPLNSQLDTRRFRQAFDLELPHWTVGVDRVLDAWLPPAPAGAPANPPAPGSTA